MSILVNELRLSLVWNKAFFRDSYLPYLSDPERYRSGFESARQGAGSWLLPWQSDKAQHFWQYYLGPAAPGDFHSVTPQNAREYFVPLRAPAWAQAKARSGVMAVFEGFCFPHSVGVVITLYIRPESPLPIDQMVDTAITARFADFNLTWKDSEPPTHGALVSLADKIVDRLHAKALDGQTPRGKPLKDPITVATIIDATGVWNASKDASVGLGRALNALCLLKPSWKELAFANGLGDNVAPTADALHAIERGRVIWLPAHFSEFLAKGRRTSLGCYHRNLTLASTQTWGLTALIGRADEVLADPKGRLLNIQHRDVAQAISLLDNLDRGSFETYQTWSVKHQISFNLERINRVRAAIGK